MIRALLLFLLILLAVVTSVLTRLNIEPVIFNYYFGTVEISLALLLVVGLLGGVLLGMLLTAGWALASRAERRRLRRTLQLREQEIRNLRDIPIKDQH